MWDKMAISWNKHGNTVQKRIGTRYSTDHVFSFSDRLKVVHPLQVFESTADFELPKS